MIELTEVGRAWGENTWDLTLFMILYNGTQLFFLILFIQWIHLLYDLFIKCIQIVNEFIENKQGTDDVIPTSNHLKVAENIVILETPQKSPKKLLYETPDLQHSLSQFKYTGLFLSPATENFHESIEKATQLSEVVYNSRILKEVQ